MNRLFTSVQVSKFFHILWKLERFNAKYYKGIYGGDHEPCQKDVFIRRTVNKWFSGKCYKQLEAVKTGISITSDVGFGRSKPVMSEQVRYIKITSIRFNYGHGDDFTVSYRDASKPSELFKGFKLGHNESLRLVGEEISDKEFETISKMFQFDIINCEDCKSNVLHSDIRENGEILCDECDMKRKYAKIEEKVEKRMKADKKKV
ncbi:MAG: hypothetical protein ACTSQA_06795 [Candidatus Heimdallarchaeaceae archaeon]